MSCNSKRSVIWFRNFMSEIEFNHFRKYFKIAFVFHISKVRSSYINFLPSYKNIAYCKPTRLIKRIFMTLTLNTIAIMILTFTIYLLLQDSITFNPTQHVPFCIFFFYCTEMIMSRKNNKLEVLSHQALLRF